MGTTADPLSSSDFNSLDQRVANQLVNSVWTINLLNSQAIARYKSQTDSAAFAISQGHNNTPWPDVPIAWELTPKDVNGFQFWQQGKTPVCPVVPRPADGVFGIGGSGQAAIDDYQKFHRGMNTSGGETPDNPPIGTEITDSEGHKWAKTLAGVTPWGRAVEWRRQ